MEKISNVQLREFKSRGQLLEPSLKIGKEGLTPAFYAALDVAFQRTPLLKIKFDSFKEQKKELTPVLVEQSRSHLIMRVGNVVVLYRPPAQPEAAPAA